MKKFDLFTALTEKGFTESTDEYGRTVLSNHYEAEADVAWYGKVTTYLYVDVYFNSDKTYATVNYTHNIGRAPFKTKGHFNDKRAYNAIGQTVENNGFIFYK